jgi:polyisoprenoid-binding protein YceI
MKKYALLAASCLLVSPSVLASPRVLLAAESKIDFVVKEMGVPVSGEFKRFEAAIDIDPVKPEKSSASLKIQVGSLTTGSDEADAIAVDADWLDKVHAPYALFKSTSIRALGNGSFEAKGTLSIRNLERPIVLHFTSADQAGGKTIITSEFTIKRAEFKIGGGEWNQGDVVGEEIPVKVRLTLAPAH